MEKYLPAQFEVDINPDAPLFIISVVSDMVGIPIWTLRKLDELGVVEPKRLGKKTRCYTKVQIQQLNYVHYLMDEKGVNISGIKVILEMNYSQEGSNIKEE
ncbi:MAG: MerR family transcriptional regulator [Candidatus Omnitrophica bacterium]|nr:MerR family transcriptional regulator [Candidatus Omnitrophota bacterium]